LGDIVTQAKRRQRHKLEQVQSKVEQHQNPAKQPDEAGNRPRPRNEEERRALVEQRIQEAMKRGEFDNLPGKGKPLPLNPNPYLEPGQELAFGLLKNNGFAPDWIERDKHIRRELAAARGELRLAWQRRQAEPGWRAAVARFESRLEKLNRQIDDFNLIVPIISSQRRRLRLADELRRIKKEEV
jgi:DnaJ family protein C protein 28